MKKLIFFILLICFSFAVNAQSQSIGLRTSYFSHLISHNSRVGNKKVWKEFYKSPQLSLGYNYLINEKHGIVAGLGIIKLKREFSEPSVIPYTTIFKNYHTDYSLHYIFKHKQFFAKSGFNVQIFDVLKIREDIIFHDLQGSDKTVNRNSSINREQIRIAPEFHFALGRDFDLEKINIRVNGFVERAFMTDDYIDVGLSTSVFYQFGK